MTEEKKTKVRELQKWLKSMNQEQREQFISKVGAIVTIEGHRLSGVNTMLCLYQCPGVTVVGGYKQWQKANRQVKRGEHGFIIWFPKFNKPEGSNDDSDDLELSGYLLGTVFDISQTEEI